MTRYGDPIHPITSDETPKDSGGQTGEVFFGGCGYGVGPLPYRVPRRKPGLFARLRTFIGLAPKKAPKERSA